MVDAGENCLALMRNVFHADVSLEGYHNLSVTLAPYLILT